MKVLLIVMFLFTIILGIIGIYNYTTLSNPTIKSFATNTNLQGKFGCPTGKINVIGAFSDIYDPYGSCTTTPTARAVACTPNSTDPLCKNIHSGGYNPSCSVICTPNDISAIVSDLCRGKSECDLSSIQISSIHPCPSVDKTKLPSDGVNQGVYIHGIYTCV